MAKFFSGVPMAQPPAVPISSSTITVRNGANGEAATQARRIHAAGFHPHRRVALSGRLARCQFQFPAYQETDPETGGRKVRRLLHGRPSGRAEHAGQRAEAQPHGDVVRTVHAIIGAGRRHGTYRPDRDGIDHVRRALSRCAPVCLARSHFRRPCRVEYRHHFQSRRRAEFRARRPYGTCRALQARP